MTQRSAFSLWRGESKHAFLLRATLEVMMPVGYHSLLTVRREKTICAISALAQNTRDAPSIVAALRAGARQLREAAPLAKKLHDVPLSLVLEYLSLIHI